MRSIQDPTPGNTSDQESQESHNLTHRILAQSKSPTTSTSSAMAGAASREAGAAEASLSASRRWNGKIRFPSGNLNNDFKFLDMIWVLFLVANLVLTPTYSFSTVQSKQHSVLPWYGFCVSYGKLMAPILTISYWTVQTAITVPYAKLMVLTPIYCLNTIFGCIPLVPTLTSSLASSASIAATSASQKESNFIDMLRTNPRPCWRVWQDQVLLGKLLAIPSCH